MSRIPNLDNLKKGFQAPPIDGSLSVPQIYDWHLIHNVHYPVFLYQSEDGGAKKDVVLTYGHVVPAAHEAGRYISRATGVSIDPSVKLKPVIAVMSASDSITLFTTLLGMMRSGILVYLISPRNSPVAVAHLLSAKQVHHLVVSAEPHVQQLAHEAVEELKKNKNIKVDMLPMPRFEDLYHCTPADVSSEGPSDFDPLPKRSDTLSEPMYIVHSSGSTAFPKPVAYTSRMQLQLCRSVATSAFDWCGEVFAVHGLPMFHLAGLGSMTNIIAVGNILAVFPPVFPTVIPTPESTFRGAIDSGATLVFAMPSNIESWTKDATKVDSLRLMKAVIFGAAPIQDSVGAHLVHVGVRMYNLYGLSEAGCISEFLGSDWKYFSLNPVCKDAVRFKSLDDGTYEIIVLNTPNYEIALSNCVYDGHDAYATKDIAEPHPTRKGLWRIVGRLDDQIMLSTGEKTNPGPLESILRGHPMVKDSLMFGRGHFQNGILVAPKDEYKFDHQDKEKLNAFRDAIWYVGVFDMLPDVISNKYGRPMVERMNAYAPRHSRLSKEMILVEDPKRPFQFSAKGFPRRAPVLAEYDADIEALYAEVEATSVPDSNVPEDWTLESAFDFVKQLVHGTMRIKVTAEQNFFLYGCDSLQATWIRSALMKALHAAKVLPSDIELPGNIVYDYPTLNALARCVMTVVSAKSGSTIRASNEQDLLAYVERYVGEFFKEVESQDTSTGPLSNGTTDPVQDVVLLTGSTGSLGTGLLAQLVATDAVAKIYAFNRPSSSSKKTVDRQRELLKLRGYDKGIATSSKVVYVDATMTVDGIAIGDKTVEDEIRSSVTHIIHNAWRVDWKMSLDTFQDCVESVVGLAKLALSSPHHKAPKLLFVSSIGVLRNHRSGTVLEQPITDPKTAFGQGYSESKWVAESILYAIQERTRLRPVIVRIGQVSGSVNGAWNQSDWVPAIVKTSLTLGCFPILKGVCSWLGVQGMAGALVDARDCQYTTLHLLHHRPMPWGVLAQVCADEFGVALVPYGEWFAKLKTAMEEELDVTRRQTLPAGMLLEFLGANLQKQDVEGEETFGMGDISVDKMVEVSQTLREAKSLGPEDVRQWLSFWKSTGFL
ncbi:acetyl-CoA synthetase-like protein [Fistulina hepatica ATCC 64428]|uniref:Acetyl-CoA synthetase-like protein n=1 Tax=Fistulina hepatica ATCC 64428 TaxID=1128425 RepID=A0A0D7A2R7_9AGAR|nr:acetyl-CoA synthetase-like protein [Fistulina hepatica ATCC 64428]